jgi:hypothetical protein
MGGKDHCWRREIHSWRREIHSWRRGFWLLEVAELFPGDNDSPIIKPGGWFMGRDLDPHG